MAERAFKAQLQDTHQSLRESILSELSDAGHDAVGTLWELLQSADGQGVRLRAAKAVLSVTTFYTFPREFSRGTGAETPNSIRSVDLCETGIMIGAWPPLP